MEVALFGASSSSRGVENCVSFSLSPREENGPVHVYSAVRLDSLFTAILRHSNVRKKTGGVPVQFGIVGTIPCLFELCSSDYHYLITCNNSTGDRVA